MRGMSFHSGESLGPSTAGSLCKDSDYSTLRNCCHFFHVPPNFSTLSPFLHEPLRLLQSFPLPLLLFHDHALPFSFLSQLFHYLFRSSPSLLSHAYVLLLPIFLHPQVRSAKQRSSPGNLPPGEASVQFSDSVTTVTSPEVPETVPEAWQELMLSDAV